jgi:excisionase family DNA binding protein
MPEPLSHRPVEIAEMTGLSSGFIYKLIAQGSIPSVRVGRSLIVLHDDLMAFLDAHRSGGDLDAAAEESFEVVSS